MKQLISRAADPTGDFPDRLAHPIFALLGFRGVVAEHTALEESTLQKHAAGCQAIVEVGVYEGASAAALRRVAHPDGLLFLIDPYVGGRIPWLNLRKQVAQRHVDTVKNARVQWLQEYSHDASISWSRPIDFLFIDADHSYEASMRDWKEWSPFVVRGGCVAMHDARIFPGGWTTSTTGSVRAANELFRVSPNTEWSIVEEVDSLVIVRRNLSA